MRRTWRFAVALLGSLALLLLALGAQARTPQAVDGVLELSGQQLRRPVPLDGQWGFAWQQFVDPHWQQLPTQALAPVPSSWNELPGKPPGENGWGSYVLQVPFVFWQSVV